MQGHHCKATIGPLHAQNRRADSRPSHPGHICIHEASDDVVLVWQQSVRSGRSIVPRLRACEPYFGVGRVEPADRSRRTLDCGGSGDCPRARATAPSCIRRSASHLQYRRASSTLAAAVIHTPRTPRTSSTSPSAASPPLARLAWSCHPYLRLRCAKQGHSGRP